MPFPEPLLGRCTATGLDVKSCRSFRALSCSWRSCNLSPLRLTYLSQDLLGILGPEGPGNPQTISYQPQGRGFAFSERLKCRPYAERLCDCGGAGGSDNFSRISNLHFAPLVGPPNETICSRIILRESALIGGNHTPPREELGEGRSGPNSRMGENHTRRARASDPGTFRSGPRNPHLNSLGELYREYWWLDGRRVHSTIVQARQCLWLEVLSRVCDGLFGTCHGLTFLMVLCPLSLSLV